MYGVELYAALRLAVVEEGLSHHEAGRRFGIDRRTVKKMLSHSAPPGYRRRKPVRRLKLDGFTGIVDAILEADGAPDVPVKQRHTAHRIFERLRDEHGFTVSGVGEAPSFQLDGGLKLQGRSSSMRLLGWPAAIFSSVSLIQA